MRDKIIKWFRVCNQEFRQGVFKRPVGSRIRWAIASIITLALAYYAHLNVGYAPPSDPWGNTTGQLMLAMRDVGIIAGSIGLLFMVILGFDNPKREKKNDK